MTTGVGVSAAGAVGRGGCVSVGAVVGAPVVVVDVGASAGAAGTMSSSPVTSVAGTVEGELVEDLIAVGDAVQAHLQGR